MDIPEAYSTSTQAKSISDFTSVENLLDSSGEEVTVLKMLAWKITQTSKAKESIVVPSKKTTSIFFNSLSLNKKIVVKQRTFISLPSRKKRNNPRDQDSH